MRKLLAALVGGALVAGILGTTLAPPASAAPTRAQLKARAETLAFSMSLGDFIKVQKQSPKVKVIDRSFNWGNDGCSLPRAIKPVAIRWDGLFTRACIRHDFGYRNFGNGLALSSNQTTKARVDSRFRSDMRGICAAKVGGTDNASCLAAAEAFYLGVSRFGKAQTAFFKKKCPAGSLCLFDDKNFEDRRITPSGSVSKLGDSPYSFNDKTSSVINRSGRAWVLYDDSGYSDRRFCIPPGVSVRDWGVDAYKFNDKTSSVKKMSGSACPSGTPVIQQG